MRAVMDKYGSIGTDHLVTRLRVGFGLVLAAMCVAFLAAGAPMLELGGAMLVVGAIAFGPKLARAASALQPSRFRMSASASVAVMLCCSLTMVATVGCTPEQQKKAKDVVGLIGYETQRALPVLGTLTGVAATLLPAEAPLVIAVAGTAQSTLAVLAQLCQNYAASPTEDTWNSIVATINGLVNSGSAALLDAAHIVNPDSRALAQAALGGLQTVLLIIDGYVQSARTKAQNKAAAQARVVKLRELEPFLDRKQIEQASGYSFDQVYGYETALGY